MTPDISKILHEVRVNLIDVYGDRLSKLLLFGSHARGDAEPGSDIDVMVVLKGDVKPGVEISRVGKITADLSLEYDVVISCLFISEERFHNENSPLMLNVRKEGVAA